MQRAAVGLWGTWQMCPQEEQLHGGFHPAALHPRGVLHPSCPALLEHKEEGDVHLLAAATAWAGAAGTKRRRRRADYRPKPGS